MALRRTAASVAVVAATLALLDLCVLGRAPSASTAPAASSLAAASSPAAASPPAAESTRAPAPAQGSSRGHSAQYERAVDDALASLHRDHELDR